MDYVELHTRDQFAQYVQTLIDTTIALDLEGEFNLHEYGEKLCLIQIYDGRNFVIIDPCKFEKTMLASIFENPQITKVMYGASSDLSLLKNWAGLTCRAVLDLQLGIALLQQTTMLLNLHAAIASYLGVAIDCSKSKKSYQKYNWTKRPYDPDALQYALNDVKYLLALQTRVMAQLDENGLREQFFMKNDLLLTKDYRRTPGENLRKKMAYRRLSRADQARFDKVFHIREQYAKNANLPPNAVIENSELFEIARNVKRLDAVQFPRRLQNAVVAELRQAIAAALN